MYTIVDLSSKSTNDDPLILTKRNRRLINILDLYSVSKYLFG